jgi:hypothetical protein
MLIALAACAARQPPYVYPTYSGLPVHPGQIVYIMKTDGSLVTFEVKRIVSGGGRFQPAGLMGDVQFVRNQDIKLVVIAGYQNNPGRAVVASVEQAKKFAKLLEAIKDLPGSLGTGL